METTTNLGKIMDKINFKKALIVIGVIMTVVVIYSVITLLSRVGKVAVDIKYVPYAATVKLDGEVVSNNAVNYIKAGTYNVLVEFENFESAEIEVEITENTKYLYGVLNPINDAGIEYMEKHSEELSEIQDISDALSGKIKEALLEKYPLFNKLPINDPYFTIDYEMPNDLESIDGYVPTVIIDASLAYRELAVSKLLGIADDETFGKYNIVFKNLDNPYAGKFRENNSNDPIEFIKVGYSGVGFDFEVGNAGNVLVEEDVITSERGWADEDDDNDAVIDDIVSDDYYYTYLRSYYDGFVSVIFRLVLVRNGDGWKLVADPYPLLTSFNTPDVPVEILNRVNEL
ncbi:PEGA domain-containing protein [Candidatus Saccharibacteria bacterium]|nr:PEGA domain-containing protein [Candidatus Saccharibacteria bacterium]